MLEEVAEDSLHSWGCLEALEMATQGQVVTSAERLSRR